MTIDKDDLRLLFPHEDNCGLCEYGRLMETILNPVVLRESPKPTQEEIQDAREHLQYAWKKTKYFQFANECQEKGLNWQEEFKKLGWEP